MSQRIDRLTGESKRRLVLRISVEPLLRLLPGLFYLANLIRMMSISIVPYMVAVYAIGGLGLLTMLFSKQNNWKTSLLLFFIYLISLLFNCLIIGNVSLSNIGINALLYGITIVMLSCPWTLKEGAFVFCCTAIILLARMSAGSFLRMLGSSANYISVIILLSVSFYYIALEHEEREIKEMDLLPAFVSFLISVWARGRGGILSATILILLLLFIYMRTITQKNKKRFVILVFLVFMIGAVYILVDYSLIDAFMGLGKWSTRGTDISDRLTIWGDYLSAVGESIIYFLFGVPYENAYYIQIHGGNCHNSFLQLHAYGGLMISIVFFSMMIKSFCYYVKEKRFIIVSMMFTIFLRGMSDKFIFGQYGMPIMLYFIIFPYFHRDNHLEFDCLANHSL